jgi:hypothetical protein
MIAPNTAFAPDASGRQRRGALLDAAGILEPKAGEGVLGGTAVVMALMLAHMTADAAHRRALPAQAAVLAPHLQTLAEAMGTTPLDMGTRQRCADACRLLADLVVSSSHS